jgi:hypothetical protein
VKLALALNELAPADTAFSLIASWERRIASQLDPLDSGIASFLPRVITVVQGVLGTVLQNLQTRFSNDPHAGDHMRVIRGILYVVAQKAQ